MLKTHLRQAYRSAYLGLANACSRRRPDKSNPAIRVHRLADCVADGRVRFREKGSTVKQARALPDLHLEDAYQASHLRHYQDDGSGWTYPFGVVELDDARLSFPYPIHRWQGGVLQECLGDSLKYLCEPWYAWGYYATFLPPRATLEAAILLPLPSYENFYHWTIETLPRLGMIAGDGRYDGVPIVLPERRTPGFVRRSIAASGFADRIRYLPSGSYRARTLYVPTLYSPRNEPSGTALAWLNDNLSGKLDGIRAGLDDPSYARIYVARDDAGSRGVANAAELEQLFGRLGIRKLNMSEFSLQEQAYLFRHAKLIVGIHGAALSNLAYCQPGAVFLEIFMEGWFTRAYFNIARLRGLGYGYLLCPKYQDGIIVDTEMMENLIAAAGQA